MVGVSLLGAGGQGLPWRPRGMRGLASLRAWRRPSLPRPSFCWVVDLLGGGEQHFTMTETSQATTGDRPCWSLPKNIARGEAQCTSLIAQGLLLQGRALTEAGAASPSALSGPVPSLSSCGPIRCRPGLVLALGFQIQMSLAGNQRRPAPSLKHAGGWSQLPPWLEWPSWHIACCQHRLSLWSAAITHIMPVGPQTAVVLTQCPSFPLQPSSTAPLPWGFPFLPWRPPAMQLLP